MNNKVYYIKASIQLPKVGKVAITKHVCMPSSSPTIEGVKSNKNNMEYIRKQLKTDKFEITEVTVIQEL